MHLAIGISLLCGCGKEQPIVEEIRSLRTITVGEVTTGQVRKFSGVVRAVERSGLSFEVSGNVQVVNVDIGARVAEGDVLAELDKEPYELELQKAAANLATANASVEKQKAEFDRQKRLFEQGAGSQRRLEQAEFAFKEAEASVEATQSALDLAKRDLRKTVLHAPYDGMIGVRQVEPFVDVRRGEVLFEIDAEGEREIVVDIPETVVNLLSAEMPVGLSFPTLPGTSVDGKVTEVGTLAGAGSAFPVKVRLLDPPARVRSGMTAEATFELSRDEAGAGYPIPGQAINPTREANRGFVYVFDPDTSTVKQSPVKWRGVKDNFVVVTDGVAAGDVLAVAGVSFLSDGMKVKLLPEKIEAKPETLDVE